MSVIAFQYRTHNDSYVLNINDILSLSTSGAPVTAVQHDMFRDSSDEPSVMSLLVCCSGHFAKSLNNADVLHISVLYFVHLFLYLMNLVDQ